MNHEQYTEVANHLDLARDGLMTAETQEPSLRDAMLELTAGVYALLLAVNHPMQPGTRGNERHSDEEG